MRQRIRWQRIRTGLAAGIVAATVSVAAALPTAAAPLTVGSHVPAIAAVDQNGGMRNLETLAPNKGVVLLFTRSLHW